MCISAVCQIAFGGIKKVKSSFFPEEQQVPSVRNVSLAAARAQTSEAGPNFGLVTGVCCEPCGMGWARMWDWCQCPFPDLSCRDLMAQPARQSKDVSPSSSCWHRSEPHLNGTYRWNGSCKRWGMLSRKPPGSSPSKPHSKGQFPLPGCFPSNPQSLELKTRSRLWNVWDGIYSITKSWMRCGHISPPAQLLLGWDPALEVLQGTRTCLCWDCTTSSVRAEGPGRGSAWPLPDSCFFLLLPIRTFSSWVTLKQFVCVQGKKKEATNPKDFPEELFVGETEQITGYCQGLFCLHSPVNELLGLSEIFFHCHLCMSLHFNVFFSEMQQGKTQVLLFHSLDAWSSGKQWPH